MSRLQLITLAGCLRNWRAPTGNSGADSHYLNWLKWLELSEIHSITDDESDAAWAAFLARHGAKYPGGDWQAAEREFTRLEDTGR